MNTPSQFDLSATEERCLVEALAFIKKTVEKHTIRGLGGGPTDPGVPGNALISEIGSQKYQACVESTQKPKGENSR